MEFKDFFGNKFKRGHFAIQSIDNKPVLCAVIGPDYEDNSLAFIRWSYDLFFNEDKTVSFSKWESRVEKFHDTSALILIPDDIIDINPEAHRLLHTWVMSWRRQLVEMGIESCNA